MIDATTSAGALVPPQLETEYDTHSKIGGYSITYIRRGLAYCGDCIAAEIAEDTETEVTKGLTYHDDDTHRLDYECGADCCAHKVTCETCNTTISN